MARYLFAVFILIAGLATAQERGGCIGCHDGIEQFVDGPMHDAVVATGEDYGDPQGCVTCHGGDPTASEAAAAHAGSPAELADAGGPSTFYPDPGALGAAERSCGQCHFGYAERVAKSLMNTEAGKLQGNLWSWGVQESMKVVWG
ncbi:MAG: cytochrome C, partial [Pseudomonadota bacterium]